MGYGNDFPFHYSRACTEVVRRVDLLGTPSCAWSLYWKVGQRVNQQGLCLTSLCGYNVFRGDSLARTVQVLAPSVCSVLVGIP